MQTKLLAYHGSAQLKEELVREIQWHKDHDAITQGIYGQGSGADWKGCAVGCAIHSLNRIKGLQYEANDYSVYEKELGIPEVLAHLEDHVFEGLEPDQAKEWPLHFAKAIKPGADLSLVMSKLIVWLLTDKGHGIVVHTIGRDPAGIQEAAALHQRIIDGETLSAVEWNKATEEALQAVERIPNPAETAFVRLQAAAQEKWPPPPAAEAAARAAERAARQEEMAAAMAAEREAYESIASKLIELLEEAK